MTEEVQELVIACCAVKFGAALVVVAVVEGDVGSGADLDCQGDLVEANGAQVWVVGADFDLGDVISEKPDTTFCWSGVGTGVLLEG